MGRAWKTIVLLGLLSLAFGPRAQAQLDTLSQRLLQLDQALREAVALRVLEVARYLVSVEDEAALPRQFALFPAYPNPFRRQATIRFQVPEPVRARLEVYDVLGRRVGVLLDEELRPGVYEVRFEAQSLASGLYFYRLTAGDFVQQRKMILIK
ncbi:T9SS type A sorting domain-containing protein [Rhodothermus marinus]|uniref:Secretion system C-terminal sorting domain-containing protein n=1 Tax=Rhodothermus marinus (strain ATCC 43812 / DSM 4252 / R-10) TaxID=518766 RepID=D0MHD9_RHOM4|nr:T9SS type A sorting domain-containing protein [Rhodothermus marinus]ACY47897.1 hypothetical protein Rmar_1003 [Rhodothermus marinus DSM 4252]